MRDYDWSPPATPLQGLQDDVNSVKTQEWRIRIVSIQTKY